MLRDYVGYVRGGLPPRRLVLLVSPFRVYDTDNLGITVVRSPRDVTHEASVLFDDQIGNLAGGPDIRWRGIAVVEMHELGHLLGDPPLTHPEEHPELHNTDYRWGCIMRMGLIRYDFERVYDDGGDPLIFCRTDGSHGDQTTTCHGKLRQLFGLPYGVEH